MRVLVSSICNFWISRKAVERARELDAAWAFPDHTPLVGEPEHFAAEDDDEERWEDVYSLPDTVPRHDPVLLQLYDELGQEMVGGDKVDGEVRCLEIPDDVTYYVGSYIGEWIAEQHREWFPDSPSSGVRGGRPAFNIDSRFTSERT